VQLPDGASLQRTQEIVAKVTKVARETPGVAHTVSLSGLSFVAQAASPNFASMFIVLDPFDKRQAPRAARRGNYRENETGWAKEIREEAVVTANGAAPVPGLGVAGGFKFVVQDRGDNGLEALQSQTETLVRKLRDIPGLSDVTTQFRSKSPQLFLDIDRTKAAALGVSLNDVNQTLDMYMGVALRQQLQRLRPPLAGHDPGGGRLPHRSVED